MTECEEVSTEELRQRTEQVEPEEFGELIRYTLAGYVGGLIVGFVLDQLGFQRSALGQWLVRTLAGEGESIFEGIYAIRARLAGKVGSMAEAYGWGKLLGMVFPWLIDALSRLAGVDVYGWQAFCIPYLYAMSDQIGASAAGLVFLRRRESSWFSAAASYFRHPVMLASLGVVLIVPVGLLGARLLGFSPTTQVYTAIETIAANLCWVPPLVGWLRERKGQER
jgi:hypothetical protein